MLRHIGEYSKQFPFYLFQVLFKRINNELVYYWNDIEIFQLHVETIT